MAAGVVFARREITKLLALDDLPHALRRKRELFQLENLSRRSARLFLIVDRIVEKLRIANFDEPYCVKNASASIESA